MCEYNNRLRWSVWFLCLTISSPNRILPTQAMWYVILLFDLCINIFFSFFSFAAKCAILWLINDCLLICEYNLFDCHYEMRVHRSAMIFTFRLLPHTMFCIALWSAIYWFWLHIFQLNILLLRTYVLHTHFEPRHRRLYFSRRMWTSMQKWLTPWRRCISEYEWFLTSQFVCECGIVMILWHCWYLLHSVCNIVYCLAWIHQ